MCDCRINLPRLCGNSFYTAASKHTRDSRLHAFQSVANIWCFYFFVSGVYLHVKGTLLICELSFVVQPQLAR